MSKFWNNFLKFLNFLRKNSGKFLFWKNSNGSNGSVPRWSNFSTLVPAAARGTYDWVGAWVERFDRRGIEPFKPFEFFQNRNFPEFFLRKFKNFRKFQHFLNYRRNSDKNSSKWLIWAKISAKNSKITNCANVHGLTLRPWRNLATIWLKFGWNLADVRWTFGHA